MNSAKSHSKADSMFYSEAERLPAMSTADYCPVPAPVEEPTPVVEADLEYEEQWPCDWGVVGTSATGIQCMNRITRRIYTGLRAGFNALMIGPVKPAPEWDPITLEPIV